MRNEKSRSSATSRRDSDENQEVGEEGEGQGAEGGEHADAKNLDIKDPLLEESEHGEKAGWEGGSTVDPKVTAALEAEERAMRGVAVGVYCPK